MRSFCVFCNLILGLVVTGCSKAPSVDDGFVSCVVANRVDSQVEWRRGCYYDERAQDFMRSMIGHELNAETAIQIALLNNPKVKAVFE